MGGSVSLYRQRGLQTAAELWRTTNKCQPGGVNQDCASIYYLRDIIPSSAFVTTAILWLGLEMF